MVSRIARSLGRMLIGATVASGLLVVSSVGAAPARAGAGQGHGFGVVLLAQETTAAQDEFVPIDELPPEDRLPAAPFLVSAYTVTLVLLVGYVWLLWRRLETVRRELHGARQAVGQRQGGAGG